MKLYEKEMSEELKALWLISKKKRLHDNLLSFLTKGVRNVKNQFKRNAVDVFQNKLNTYGNDGSWGDQKIKELSKILYSDKVPAAVNIGEWISVEIECIFANEQAETKFVKFVRSNAWSKFVTIKNDGSIKTKKQDHDCGENYDEEGNLQECNSCNPLAYGREIVISFKYGEWEFVKAICNKLNELKCEVNKSCGLHVHFDCRHISARQVSSVGKKIANVVPALKAILPPSRSNNRFCNEAINRHGDNRGDSRYSFVNLQSYGRHKTLEIRGHSGTTDATKIINWIRILRTVMKTRGSNVAGTVSELVTSFTFEADLVEYMNERYTKFSTPNNQQDDVASDNNNNSYTMAG